MKNQYKLLALIIVLAFSNVKAQVVLCPDIASFTSMTRGYHFTAPCNFTIYGLFVEDARSTSAQSVEIVRFNAGAPPAWTAVTNSITSLFYQNNYVPNNMIAVPGVSVNTGDIIGIYGSRATINSYGASACPVTIEGFPVTLLRSGMQYDLATQQMHDVWSEVANNIGRVTMYTSPSLPIELISFEGNCVNSTIELKWELESEINNDYFTIEKSEDGIRFSTIGTIEADESVSDYSFIDKKVNNKNLYRLKQTDIDGTESYYTVIEVSCNQEPTFKIYPTLVENELTISSTKKGDYTIEIKDYLGREVLTENLKEDVFTQKVNLNKITSKGIYFVFLKNEQGQILATEKIVKE